MEIAQIHFQKPLVLRGPQAEWFYDPFTGCDPLTIDYTVEGRNIAGCTTQKSITITVLCRNQNLFVPNTFSSNGDGMNDYFYPRRKGLLQ